LQHRRRKKSEEGKNCDKRTVMEKLITTGIIKVKLKKKKPNKITRFRNHRKFSLLVKVLKFFLRCPVLVLAYRWKL
jgi:hypothetical protein